MDQDIFVTIQQGILQGKREFYKTEAVGGPKTGEYYSFQGIPYAKPPVAELRFKAPQDPETWIGIRDATKESTPCLNLDFFSHTIEGGEDCLQLNVFTTNLPQVNNVTTNLKPVMVWIHGGGFITGSNKRNFYDPEFLICKDIVLVIINYRLGALGFLSLQDSQLGVSGNSGLKDQVMALKWVQKNIECFGGDANNVTIFGESAGAASVSLHLLSPMSKGLFHKAIIQSGVATCPWAEGRNDTAKELIKILDKTADTDEEILRILQALSSEELIKTQVQVPDIWKPSSQRYFSPIVENSVTEEVFLPDKPINILKSGNFSKVPVIMGCTSAEGLLMYMVQFSQKEELTPTSNSDFVPFTFALPEGDIKSEIGKRIKEFYYGTEEQSIENRLCFINYISDAYFNRALLEVVELLLDKTNENIFLYKFNIHSKLNIFNEMFKINNYEGVCHGEDLFYLFKSDLTPSIESGSVESVAIERLTTYWTNFAKYSDPNGDLNNKHNTKMLVNWPATTSNHEYLEFSQDLHVKTNLEGKMLHFWNEIESQL